MTPPPLAWNIRGVAEKCSKEDHFSQGDFRHSGCSYALLARLEAKMPLNAYKLGIDA